MFTRIKRLGLQCDARIVKHHFRNPSLPLFNLSDRNHLKVNIANTTVRSFIWNADTVKQTSIQRPDASTSSRRFHGCRRLEFAKKSNRRFSNKHLKHTDFSKPEKVDQGSKKERSTQFIDDNGKLDVDDDYETDPITLHKKLKEKSLPGDKDRTITPHLSSILFKESDDIKENTSTAFSTDKLADSGGMGKADHSSPNSNLGGTTISTTETQRHLNEGAVHKDLEKTNTDPTELYSGDKTVVSPNSSTTYMENNNTNSLKDTPPKKPAEAESENSLDNAVKKTQSISKKNIDSVASSTPFQDTFNTDSHKSVEFTTGSSAANNSPDLKHIKSETFRPYRNSQPELAKLLTFMADESIISKSSSDKPRSFFDSDRPRKLAGFKYNSTKGFNNQNKETRNEFDKLTPEDIRKSFQKEIKSEKVVGENDSELSDTEKRNIKQTSSPPSQPTKSDTEEHITIPITDDTPLTDQLLADLDATLGFVRNDRIRHDNERFRLENAYAYSKEAMRAGVAPRTLESRNFFTPVHVDTFYSPPAQSYTDVAKEYIILTPSQKTITTNYRPFKTEAVTQDLFTTLSNLERPEKYIKSIMKLENQGWSIIGGGGPGDLVVFEREYNKRKRNNLYLLKIALGLTGVVTVILVGLMATVEVPITRTQKSSNE